MYISQKMTSNTWYTKNRTSGMMNSIYTFVVFFVTCIAFWLLGAFYFVINFIRDSWLNHLEKRFPDLEFVKKTNLRSVVDTHRNMGIITLLATVKGNCNPQLIKRRLVDEILEKRQNNGQHVYRHLRRILTTRWGWYAWQKPGPFNVDNHLIFASPYYRGRAISDANLQECISETVSKYLVPDVPPWQITVFQVLTGDKYYMLIRFHHMLLSHEGMDLGSLFTISKNLHEVSVGNENVQYDNDDDDDDDNEKGEKDENERQFFPTFNSMRRSHPFQDLYKTPKAIPTSMEKLYEAFSNTWNEFLSLYDPIENPVILKNPGLTTTLAVFAIVIIAVVKQLILNPRMSVKILRNSLAEKNLTWSFVLWSLWKTLNPFTFAKNIIKTMYNIFILFIKLPLFMACEFRSFCNINNDNYEDVSCIKSLFAVWTILKDTMKEVFYYWKLLYNGPRVVVDEFLSANKCASHQLQYVSLCGRKVVSWSDGVPIEKIREIEDVTGASMSEILITATSASLRDFLVQYNLDIPDTITTTARFYPQETLINKFLPPCGSGILCLPLPIRNPFGQDYDPVTELRAVQQIVLRARIKQPALYLASLTQLEYGILTQVMPAPILRLVLNLLSRRFPVILNEITPSEPGGGNKFYLWGQEVEDLMYWKPPQANICISLTLMTFGDYVRLGVMADALLSPHHAVISETFAQHIWELASASGVTTNFTNYSFVSDDSDAPDATRSSRNSTLTSSSLDLDLDDNNLNQNDSYQKYPLRKKLQFNIPT